MYKFKYVFSLYIPIQMKHNLEKKVVFLLKIATLCSLLVQPEVVSFRHALHKYE